MKSSFKFFELIISTIVPFLPIAAFPQKFIHPGINQTSKDLEYMKMLVVKNVQPWKDAFQRLKTDTDTAFSASPHTHVLRGPYGRPNIGGDDLSKSANMAYNYALAWYITMTSLMQKKQSIY